MAKEKLDFDSLFTKVIEKEAEDLIRIYRPRTHLQKMQYMRWGSELRWNKVRLFDSDSGLEAMARMN